MEQQEHNPKNTIYDAKRFIGKTFKPDDPQFVSDLKRYPFTIKLNAEGKAHFEIELDSGVRSVSPEEVGSLIIEYLRSAAEKKYKTSIQQLVISVPAEFNEIQRNVTGKAAELAGMEVRRVISEPTAAALAYGLHKKKGVEYIIVVDLGGGTLDVSILWLQGGVFVTQAMAGNNRLGGQDFNERIQKHLINVIEEKFGKKITDKEDLQQLRLSIEEAKIRLTDAYEAVLRLHLRTVGDFDYKVCGLLVCRFLIFTFQLTRAEFESLNADLFDSVVDPIKAALADGNLTPSDVDEIVLVGGSTRIPKVRQVVGAFFGKAPNFGVDPELAVVTGASVQAGVIGGGWPLQVTAMELPSNKRKVHLYTENPKDL